MAFFRNFHQNLSLPSVSSLVDTLSNAVDDLTSVVGEVSYSVADTVTEQVTSMINGLLAEDESSKIQNDKPMQGGKEENTPLLTEPKEIYMKAKNGIAETHYSNSLDLVKKGTNEDGVSDHVMGKKQCQLKGRDSNGHLDDMEVPWDLKNVGRSFKREAVGENGYFANDKLLKDGSLKSNKLTMEESTEKQGSCLYAVSENSKNQLNKKNKQRSPGIECNDSEEVHSMTVPQDLETKCVDVQKQKLSNSSLRKTHNEHPNCINEIKEKKSETFFDRKGKSITKSEGDASATIVKIGKKKYSEKSENKSGELCNKKTAGKGEKSVSKLHSSTFPETYNTSYFFHIIYTFHFNNSVSCQ